MKEGDTTERVSINKEISRFIRAWKELLWSPSWFITTRNGDTEAATLAIKDLKRFEEERNKT